MHRQCDTSTSVAATEHILAVITACIQRLCCVLCRELELLQAEGKAQREPEFTLNYEQYYPTLLPMRPPGMEETDAEAHAQDDRPPDLSLHQVASCIQLM